MTTRIITETELLNETGMTEDDLAERDERVRDSVHAAIRYARDLAAENRRTAHELEMHARRIEEAVRAGRWYLLEELGVLEEAEVESLCVISPDPSDILGDA